MPKDDQLQNPTNMRIVEMERRLTTLETASTLQQRIGRWGVAKFPDATLQSIAHHLDDEVTELMTAIPQPEMAEEAADCAILLIQIAYQGGFDLFAEVERKFAINQQRQWGAPDERGVVRHVEAQP